MPLAEQNKSWFVLLDPTGAHPCPLDVQKHFLLSTEHFCHLFVKTEANQMGSEKPCETKVLKSAICKLSEIQMLACVIFKYILIKIKTVKVSCASNHLRRQHI